MQKFEITLKNQKEKTYRIIIFFFVVLHILFFLYLLLNEILWKKALTGLVVIALYSGYRLFICNTSRQKFSYGSGFFLPFAIFFTIPWLWIIDSILFVLSTIALQKASFHFSSKLIEKRNIPFKKYTWDQFSDVVLKDNILTLDFKNNKLLQAEIASTNISEDAFNTFAKEQLVN
ncbi:MAG: hypothetical protein ACR2KX_06195 [Chitinophagaceae bacterium]